MKKMFVAAFSAVLAMSVSALDITAIVPLKEGVKGYTVTEYSIATKFGDYFKTVTSKVSHVIDPAGNDIESTQYSARGIEENKIKTSYDSLGNVLVSTGYSSGDDILWKTEVIYKKGQKTETNDYDGRGNLSNKTIYKYDNENMVDETGYDDRGALIYKTIREYDINGKPVKVCEYDLNGALDNERILTYKENGKVESQFIHDVMDGDKQRIFRYNSDDELVEITTYDVFESGNKVCGRTIIKYDDNGCVSKISDYVVAEKFGGVVNELVYMADYTYTF